jgi:uncharacterized membrane protein
MRISTRRGPVCRARGASHGGLTLPVRPAGIHAILLIVVLVVLLVRIRGCRGRGNATTGLPITTGSRRLRIAVASLLVLLVLLLLSIILVIISLILLRSHVPIVSLRRSLLL